MQTKLKWVLAIALGVALQSGALWGLASLALTASVAVGAVIPIGPGAQSQELQWATQAGGSNAEGGNGIATTARGDNYVTGEFAGTATFGEGEPNETTLTAAGGVDIFVAKYAPDGALLWATRAGGTNQEQGLGIATTARGDSYVTGLFRGTATFGEGEPNETTLTSAGSSDIFVAKYAPDGALLWATRAGSSDDDRAGDRGNGIAATARGDSYVTGLFRGTATFGEGEPNQTTLTSAGDADIFVAKYR